MHQLFEEQVEKTPHAIAVVFKEQKLSYHELNTRANQLAHYLQNLNLQNTGVKEEVLVGLCIERTTPEMLVAMLAILKAGGAYVPLDPSYPPERLNLMLLDAQVKVLIAQHKWVTKLRQSEAQLVCIDTDWEVISQQSQENPDLQVSSDNLAYVIYTSGSTGKPKGVAIPHRAIARLLLNANYIQIDSTDNIAQVSNISFDAATLEIWGALLHGAKLVIIDRDTILSPHDFANCIRDQEISILFLTTALFERLASLVPQAFQPLKYLLFGGETVNPQRVREVLKNNSPQQLLHVYGPTESTTFASWYLIEKVSLNATNLPIGKPISNTQIYILDCRLQPVPIGVPGELYIGGDGLAREYLNRRELNAEKFIPNPFYKSKQTALSARKSKNSKVKTQLPITSPQSPVPSPQSPIPNYQSPTPKLYKTGDLARYLADGNIEYLGRIDNQVKIRGFRIELGEIEAILNQYPGIRECVVLAREDKPDNKYLVAYIVPDHELASPQLNLTRSKEQNKLADKSLSESIRDIRSHLKEKLPEYMLPSRFVLLPKLPLTANGKINYRALPKPEEYKVEETAFIAPQTPTQEIIAEIWTEVLGVNKVSIHDNFFEIGGHSLLATLVMGRLHDSFQIDLPLRCLFENPTIASLAEIIEKIRFTFEQLQFAPGDESGNREEIEF
uniref:non-ribosomal peptide synthetase n=1 Tax=Mastigocoleus testarum TaxID=996925 RepID=UPI003898FCEC